MIKLSVNGKAASLDAEPDMPLLWALRETLQITGTKFGCGTALCGACTPHMDGQPIRACSHPLSAVTGRAIRAITTIEAIGSTRTGKATVQCGSDEMGQRVLTAVPMRVAEEPMPLS